MLVPIQRCDYLTCYRGKKANEYSYTKPGQSINGLVFFCESCKTVQIVAENGCFMRCVAEKLQPLQIKSKKDGLMQLCCIRCNST